ncbi:hypothetical protein HPP92_002244 [Vanilla planifolia]|uniref:BPL/LPL catalytic domain-containing protein n=1 Tax=Vanilla planifolia TaxID=51239 RepID=A0A835SED1_VANPL|nr:hypothetical protein HPP92_002244 [Vanilla planifolia]
MHISGARDVCLPLLNLIRTRGFPILQQLHLEERLLRTSSSNWCIINDGTNQVNVVMGLSGRPAELIDIELLLQDRIPVIRRFTGGGTVVIPAVVFSQARNHSDFLCHEGLLNMRSTFIVKPLPLD